MTYYTVTLRLDGALSDAVAVEWTNHPAPVDSGQGWEPCLRRPDGTWRFSSHDPSGADQPHRRAPGPFGDLAIRYRLSAAGPWSVASQSRKEIVILDVSETGGGPDPEPPLVAPLLVAAPALLGAGVIGTEVTVTPGLWSGAPTPQLAFQWRRDGADIPGATAAAYVPGPEDDLTDLDCAVTARNAAGEAVAVTASLRVAYATPTLLGDLPEEIFDEGDGPQFVETAFVFAGANLTFSATGVGVTIDPLTGVLAVPTNDPVSGATVTITAANSGGEAVAQLLYTVEAAPPIDVEEPGAQGEWRPLYARPSGMFGASLADHPDYFDQGAYFGEGLQIMHCIEREGNTVYLGGDMAGFRKSTDGGRRWFWPKSLGLHACIAVGLGVDPTDPQIVMAYYSATNFVAGYNNAGEPGVFRSTDGGQTFTKVLAVTKGPDRQQANLSTFACDRAGANPATRRWRLIEWSNLAAQQPHRFWRSANGGQNWTQGAALPATLNSATIYGLVMDQSNLDTLYIYCSAGLWRSVDDGGAWTRVAAPTLSAAVRGLWVDPDNGDRMLCTCQKSGGGDGVYYSSDGGASWTQVLTPGSNDVAVSTLSVGPKDANNRRTIYVCNISTDVSHKRPWIQHWLVSGAPGTTKAGQLAAGAAAPNGAWFLPRIKPTSTAEVTWANMMGKNQSRIQPHQTNVNEAVCFGNNLCWYSDNRGADFHAAHSGYGGMNSQTIAFDPDDPSRMVMAINDVQCIQTSNLPDHMFFNRLDPAIKSDILAQIDMSAVGGTGCDIVSSHASVAAARRGRVIMSMGDYSDKQALLIQNKGSKDWIVKIATVSSIPEVYCSRVNHNLALAGSHRSLDAGETWSNVLGGRTAVGLSRQNAGVAFATSDFLTIQRTANVTGTPTWTNWYANSRSKRDPSGEPWFWLSPHDDAKAVTLDTNGDLILVTGAATGAKQCDMLISEEYPNRKLTIRYSGAAWCPLDPRRFYVYVKSFGRAMMWRGYFNAGYTSIAWEDVTRNLPRTANTRQITVHAVTGDLWASNGGGIWCLPAPGPLHGDSVWSRLPRAFRQDGSY